MAISWALSILSTLMLAGCNADSDAPVAIEADGGVETATLEASENDTKARPKRIILISLDTVGARNVGGYSNVDTPNMTKIADDGVRFDRFYSASTYTLPSHMSMLTGLDPIEHGVVNLPSQLAPEVPTLATQLRGGGYRTRAFVEGGYLKESHGFDRGFDEFTIASKHKDLTRTSVWRILDWMEKQGETPYFLFLHTYVAHHPYGGYDKIRDRHPELNLPSNAEIEALKARYNREVHYPAPRNLPAELRHRCTFYNFNTDNYGDWAGCGDKDIKRDFPDERAFRDLSSRPPGVSSRRHPAG